MAVGGRVATNLENNTFRREDFGRLLHSEPDILASRDDTEDAPTDSPRISDGSPRSSGYSSPSNTPPSPLRKSPWSRATSPLFLLDGDDSGGRELPRYGLIGSLTRQEGHIYSLAASGDLLHTGSDSKNIRVWKELKEYACFKSSSGLVKAIVLTGNRVFTGHQDGKIRVWKFSPLKYRRPYKRVGSLPTTRDFIRSSFNPKNYVETRRHRIVPWIRHYDAVSCLSLDEETGLLYSGSWDKTVKVWRISDSKCLESISAHDDAINAVAASGFDGMIFTGSADGTVKVWRREKVGKLSKHMLVQTLMRQESAVTSLAVSGAAAYGGSSDGLVNFWEWEKGRLRHGGVLRGHKMAVLCLASAGNMVFSGSADKTICVWRRNEGGDHTFLSVLSGHSGPVKCLAVEEDPKESSAKGDQPWIMYSGSLDRSIRVWRVSERLPCLKQLRYS
ncbi:[Myosin heavy-chain] kinase [Bertholletia excelsa]